MTESTSMQIIKFSHLVALEQNKSLAETYLIVFMFLLTTLMWITPDFVPFSNILLYAYFAVLQIYTLCVQAIRRWNLDKIFDFVTQKSPETACIQCVNPGKCECRTGAITHRREQEIDLFTTLI